MGKVVIKILYGNADTYTQTTLGGLTIYLPVANVLQCIRDKNYEIWLALNKDIAILNRLTVTFLVHPVDVLWYLDTRMQEGDRSLMGK